MLVRTDRATTIATTTSSQQSIVITAERITLLTSNVGHFIAIGSNPTATTSGMYVPANSSLVVDIDGNSNKVAVRTESGTGYMTIAY